MYACAHLSRGMVCRTLVFVVILIAMRRHCWLILVCMSVSVCVGEWSRRERSRVGDIHWHSLSFSLVIRQQRTVAGRRLHQWSHSTAEQSASPTASPGSNSLSSQAVEANAIARRWHHDSYCTSHTAAAICCRRYRGMMRRSSCMASSQHSVYPTMNNS